MTQKDCIFCSNLKDKKEINAINSSDEHRHSYSVAIVDRMYKKGQKNWCGKITDYYSRGKGYTLNYCPECGEKLLEVDA